MGKARRGKKKEEEKKIKKKKWRRSRSRTAVLTLEEKAGEAGQQEPQ